MLKTVNKTNSKSNVTVKAIIPSRRENYYMSVSSSRQSQLSSCFNSTSRGTAKMALKILLECREKRLLRIYTVIYFFAMCFFLIAISAQECFDDGNEFCINQDDILSVDLLPGSFLFSDQYQNNISKTVTNETVDGSFDKALNQMDYHR